MPRFWWDDEQVRARATGAANPRFLALVLVALMTAGATSGAFVLSVEPRSVTVPATPPTAR